MGLSLKSEHEILHGKKLAQLDVEKVWGWGTAAGKLRAKRRADLIIKNINLSPNMQVLEIGCGTGMFTELFAKAGVKIVACDISPDLLNIAKARKLPSDCVRFFEGCFEDCGFEGHFDGVIGSSILHHLDVEPAFAKIFDILKPGGVMCFAEPNMLNPQVFLERHFRFLFPYTSPDETAFIRWHLRTILLRKGFVDVKIEPFDWLHPFVTQKLIKFVSTIGNWLEKTPVVKEFSGSLCIYARHPLK